MSRAVFRPDAVYSRDELAKMLDGIVEPERFIERLAIPRRFRNAILGADVLKALENPPAASVITQGADGDPAPSVGNRKGRAKPIGGPRKSGKVDALEPIQICELLTGRER